MISPYIIIPIEWIEKEIESYGERIKEFDNIDYYMSKITLLHKMMNEFKIINDNNFNTLKERNEYEGRRKSNRT